MRLTRRIFLAVVAALAAAALFCGCAGLGDRLGKPTPDAIQVSAESRLLEHDLDIYRAGLKDYDAGRFEQAGAAFQNLVNSAADPALRRRSLYALALARFGAAKTEADYQRAMETWQAWRAGYAPDAAAEDPALVTAILPRLKAAVQPKPVPKPVARAAKGEAEARRDMARSQDDVSRLEDENRELQQKIQALEALRQEIETKQKGIIAQ